MKIYFRAKTTITCIILAALMLRLSYWQWERYLQKLSIIETLNQRLKEEPVELTSLLPSNDWTSTTFRRVRVSGTFDFDHEVVIRNRKFGDHPGALVLTPLQIKGSDKWVLIIRGFLPFDLISKESRKEFRTLPQQPFTALIKESVGRRFLAPKDKESGKDKPWVDEWLRVDVPEIEKQIPYPVLPIYLETMKEGSVEEATKTIVKDSAEKDEILNMAGKKMGRSSDLDPKTFPIPDPDTIIPPGRHFKYVFEWIVMAVATLLIGIVLQLRPRK